MATGSRQKIIDVAAYLMEIKERGGNSAVEREIKKYSPQTVHYQMSSTAMWCAATVSYIFWKNKETRDLIKRSSDTNTIATGSIDNPEKYGVFKSYDYTNPNERLLKSLRRGDIIIFSRKRADGSIKKYGHIGIFVEYNSSTGVITTIEGNHKHGKYSNSFKDRTKHSMIRGFIIPNFDDNSNVETGGDNKKITILDSADTPGVSVYPRIINTSTELKESNINDSERMWAFYTNTAYKNYSSQVPIGLNPVKKTIGTNTSNIRDMSVMKGNYLGYVIGRSMEVWDNPQNSNFAIVNSKTEAENSGRPLAFCKNGSDKWYLSQGSIPEQDSSGDVSRSQAYYEYSSYSKLPTPFNLYFGNVDNNNPINWNSITTPEKLLIHIVKKNSNFNYEPAFELEDDNDVRKGFKKIVAKSVNVPNSNCKAKVGSIAVWAHNSVSSNQTGMIMGFVEKVKSDNKILVSWSNPLAFFYSTWLNPYALANGSDILSSSIGADTRNRVNSSGVYFWGYIYPPDGANIFQNSYFLTTGSAVMNWTTDRVWVV